MKAAWTGVAIVALVAAGAAAKDHKPAESKAAITAALADPARADQADADGRRKAAEVIAFAGLGPGDTVIDFLPGQGYWTRIFSGVVGPKGHVYALWPAKSTAKTLPAIQARNLANVTAEVQTTSDLVKPGSADLAWTVQNYHDIPNNGVGEAGIDALNAAIFKALKPGGIYVVIDHADAPGTGLTGTSTKHRIDPAIVKAEVLKAGFGFVGESNALRNPADDHSLKVFDEKIRGNTDQFVYKFRKPG